MTSKRNFSACAMADSSKTSGRRWRMTPLSSPSDDASQTEGENATALWLVGLLAGCAAGSAWLSARREREADPVDANPSLIPLG